MTDMTISGQEIRREMCWRRRLRSWKAGKKLLRLPREWQQFNLFSRCSKKVRTLSRRKTYTEEIFACSKFFGKNMDSNFHIGTVRAMKRLKDWSRRTRKR